MDIGVVDSGVFALGVVPSRADAMPRDDLRGGRGAFPEANGLEPYVLSLCESSLEGTPGCSPSAVRFEVLLDGTLEVIGSVRTR